MAVLTLPQLLQEIALHFPDQEVGAITPADLRSVVVDMVDSLAALELDGEQIATLLDSYFGGNTWRGSAQPAETFTRYTLSSPDNVFDASDWDSSLDNCVASVPASMPFPRTPTGAPEIYLAWAVPVSAPDPISVTTIPSVGQNLHVGAEPIVPNFTPPGQSELYKGWYHDTALSAVIDTILSTMLVVTRQ